MEKPGCYSVDTEILAFSIEVNEDAEDEIYYAYYYSKDKEFDKDDLSKPVFSDDISPIEYSDGKAFYNVEYDKKIQKGYYVVVVAADAKSINKPYIVAYAEEIEAWAETHATLSIAAAGTAVLAAAFVVAARAAAVGRDSDAVACENGVAAVRADGAARADRHGVSPRRDGERFLVNQAARAAAANAVVVGRGNRPSPAAARYSMARMHWDEPSVE